MPNVETKEIVVKTGNELDVLPNNIETKKVIVRAGTKLYPAPAEIDVTLESLRMFMKGLVSVGHEELMTAGVEMKPFDEMNERLKSICADPYTHSRLRFVYGDTLHYDIKTAVRGLGSKAFSDFLRGIGPIDTQYSLRAVDPETPEDPTLTVVGFGSTFRFHV